jgi:hypothetical protein
VPKIGWRKLRGCPDDAAHSGRLIRLKRFRGVNSPVLTLPLYMILFFLKIKFWKLRMKSGELTPRSKRVPWSLQRTPSSPALSRGHLLLRCTFRPAFIPAGKREAFQYCRAVAATAFAYEWKRTSFNAREVSVLSHHICMDGSRSRTIGANAGRLLAALNNR